MTKHKKYSIKHLVLVIQQKHQKKNSQQHGAEYYSLCLSQKKPFYVFQYKKTTRKQSEPTHLCQSNVVR